MWSMLLARHRTFQFHDQTDFSLQVNLSLQFRCSTRCVVASCGLPTTGKVPSQGFYQGVPRNMSKCSAISVSASFSLFSSPSRRCTSSPHRSPWSQPERDWWTCIPWVFLTAEGKTQVNALDLVQHVRRFSTNVHKAAGPSTNFCLCLS